MADNIDIILVDKSGNKLEEINIEKPKTYKDLLISLKKNIIDLPQYFTIFYKSINNTEIEIHSNEEYKSSKKYYLFVKLNQKI